MADRSSSLHRQNSCRNYAVLLLMKCLPACLVLTLAMTATLATAQSANVSRGERAFRACVPCHSLSPDKNMTGPSLANLWNRQAGTLPSFSRYSEAMKSSGIIWNEISLDPWLADPQKFIAENEMRFQGIKDTSTRAALIAFLKEATKPSRAAQVAPRQGTTGMNGGGQVPNLRKLDVENRVQSIRYCRDGYKVTTADGKTRNYWERNLRFKTDASEEGPAKGAPAIVGAGMMGDRASVIFAGPEEISAFVHRGC